jgi:hypothetical protein
MLPRLLSEDVATEMHTVLVAAVYNMESWLYNKLRTQSGCEQVPRRMVGPTNQFNITASFSVP